MTGLFFHLHQNKQRMLKRETTPIHLLHENLQL
jgi:hypothetical protein